MFKTYEDAINDLMKDYGYEFLQDEGFYDDFLEWIEDNRLYDPKYVIAYYEGGDSGYIGYDGEPTSDIESAMSFDSEKDAKKYMVNLNDDWEFVDLSVEKAPFGVGIVNL